MREMRMPLFGVTFALIGALGCGSSEITCAQACDCEGLSGDKLCLSTCQANRDAAAKQAADAKCKDQAADLDHCTADNASCDGVKKQYVYPTDACRTEADALSKCVKGSSSSSTGSN